MPHRGLSWFRLKEHFRKFFAIYIVGFVVCAILSNIVFTSTTPRTPIEQEVLIYVADSYTSTSKLDHVAEEMLLYGQTNDETLLEIDFEDLQFSNPEEDYYSSMVLVTRLALQEGDAFIASSYCTDTLLKHEVYLPLDEYLANGWLEGLDLEPVTYTSETTGETCIAAVRLDNVTALAELGAVSPTGATLMIMNNSTNLETTMDVIDHMLRNMLEGNYAPAESSESAS